MKLNPQDLMQITSLTLEQYNDDAEEFWEGTRGHDVSQNIAALLQYIEGDPPFTISAAGRGATSRPWPIAAPRDWFGWRRAFHGDGPRP